MIFVRIAGIFVIAPIFGRKNIPTYYKIGFSFFLTLLAVNVVKVSNLEMIDSLLGFALVIAIEFIVGIIIGFIAYLTFSAIYQAGQLIDMQIGFGIVNVLDPMSNTQVSITSNFYVIITTLVMLVLNGHHIIIKAIFDSYKYIPIGKVMLDNTLIGDLISIYGNIFAMGFKIAAPITAAVLITDVALGITAKSMPQMNIFVVGMPLKILMGLIILAITMVMFIDVVEVIIKNIHTDIIKILKGLS